METRLLVVACCLLPVEGTMEVAQQASTTLQQRASTRSLLQFLPSWFERATYERAEGASTGHKGVGRVVKGITIETNGLI